MPVTVRSALWALLPQVHGDRVRFLAIDHQDYVSLAASAQIQCQRYVHLVEPGEFGLRSGIQYGHAYAVDCDRHVRQGTAVSDSGAEQAQENRRVDSQIDGDCDAT